MYFKNRFFKDPHSYMKTLMPLFQNCAILKDSKNGEEYFFFLSDTYDEKKGTN